MPNRHWGPKDFVVTRTWPAYDGIIGHANKAGFCAKCGADMQQFYGDPPRHYNSHKESRRQYTIREYV